MRTFFKEVWTVCTNKLFLIIVGLVSTCSYGFAITQPIIGIDDSAIGRYFSDGIGPIMGRFGFYLVNKILPVAEYTPFVLDFLGVILLIIGSICWCKVFENAINRTFKITTYIIFSSVMISAPIMSEVFIYYLHNGIGICYILSALMMHYFIEAQANVGSKKVVSYLKSLLLLFICNGFYEAFVVVFLMAIALIAAFRLIFSKMKISLLALLKSYMIVSCLIILSLILRTLMIELMIPLFTLEDQIGIMNRRSVFELLDWFQSNNGLAELVMTIKQFIAMYYVNAFAYMPITIYVISVIAFIAICIFYSINHKKYLLTLLALGIQIIPLTLLFIEGHATFYRNSQYIGLYIATVVLFITLLLENCKWAILKNIWFVLIVILVYNQALEMTQWFYVDYMKYEDAKDVMQQIAYELEHNYDTDKPVVFVGNYTIPEHLNEKMYVQTNTTQYKLIKTCLDLLDPNLIGIYTYGRGYNLSSEAIYSVFTWGNIAFEGWDKENHEFFAMHGHAFDRIENVELVKKIQAEYSYLPGFPKNGYIVETPDYIVVKFE